MTGPLRVGAARVAVTPPPGVRMSGYAARIDVADGTLDELYCRAVFLDDGVAPVVIAVCDLLAVTARLRRRVCARLRERPGLDPARLLLAATHTHCGPAGLATPDDEPVLDRIVDGIVAAVRAAADAAEPARLLTGEVDVEGIGANRRDPDGPLDITARVVAAVRPGDGGVITVLANHACHPTILEHTTTGWSADFPGAAVGTIEALCGGTALFLQGCAGDVNPVFVAHTPAEAHRTGAILGAACAQRVLALQRSAADPRVINLSWEEETPAPAPRLGRVVPPAPLRAELVDVPVTPRQRTDPEWTRREAAAARAALADADGPAARRAAGPRAAQLWIEDLLHARAAHFDCLDAPPAGDATLPVQALRIGDGLAVVGLPGEPFTATGGLIRASDPGTVLVVGYANHSSGYLPTREEFPRSGYEVGCSQYAVGTAERLTEAATGLLAALRKA
ncbi:neutral/alkaline non-lysosomal ceramidase N-terminal domain-containing protein [Micromonospora sp. NBS 11-29]|uniref:neutral/alkaline non-lysosomal ceramidase N-terminal domain-containing protein n=1 Tax=Micromonospora sp. NBS 11-29 TaxID=1960879 RepID=UPI000B788F00|nr:neutral/alkaline non-lysosomal ceramidase N-terminal domain-containing protein [Micromonospora sp. NBS 11-29]